VVAEVKVRLSVNKQRSHRFHMERFNLKKLHEVESKEQYVEVSYKFAALEDLDTEVEAIRISRLQDPSKINGDNLNNVRHEASRHFRNKKRRISERWK
jgi:predicted metalloprotease